MANDIHQHSDAIAELLVGESAHANAGVGTNSPHWYAVHVARGAEDATATKCRKLVGEEILQECFVPKYEKYLRQHGAWHLVTSPMFSEYFFVSTNNVRALSKELAKLSVPTKLVGKMGTSYMPLSNNVQTWLDSAFDDAHVLRASEGVIENGQLKVQRGPLRGREKEVRKINRHKRLAYVGFNDGANVTLRAALNVPTKQ